ncbi:MAG: high-affinity iron transporter [Roseivirga sp.]|jgi:high-affinity iron transporter
MVLLRYFAAGTLLLLSIVLKANEKNSNARMMVHLLDYIAVDYSMAINQGEIISVAEYKEMEEFANTINTLGQNAPASVKSDIKLLRTLIAEKASQEKVSSVSNSIKQRIISSYSLEIAPKRWPSLVNGRQLYALHCNSCHGENGKGNGILANALNPAPTNFHSPDKADGLSPFQAYNTIRLGVNNTSMRAFDELSDDEIWDLAFYVLSLPHGASKVKAEELELTLSVGLEDLASRNNKELITYLSLENPIPAIAALRLFPREIAEQNKGSYLEQAINYLRQADAAYANGDISGARTLALTAYLEGVEPIEIQLQASDATFSAQLEGELAKARSYIETGKNPSLVSSQIEKGIAMINEAKVILENKTFSAWLAFLLSFSIILREGLEAFLVVVTILSVLRAINIPKAKAYVHIGWISAIVVGFLMWLAAGKLFNFSGADRELMEGLVALFAVGVLLYVGFWMHSKSEAGKWQAYIKNKIHNITRKENLLGLAFLSFLVVFREAFESVLFLSALSLEVGEAQQGAFGGGIIFAFILLGIISVLLLKYSKKLPIAKLFKYSAMVISFLAVVLTGKGISALQEAGTLNITVLPFDFRLDALGLYSTYETLFGQLFILSLTIILWTISNRKKTNLVVKPA